MDKRTARSEYKSSHRPMGVFQIRNKASEKVFIDSSINIPGKMNRHKFALNAGQHASKALQADWNAVGESAFEFVTIEPLEPRSDPTYNYASDLETLTDLWLEKLRPYGDKGYNERKKTREERLRMISQKRSGSP